MVKRLINSSVNLEVMGLMPIRAYPAYGTANHTGSVCLIEEAGRIQVSRMGCYPSIQGMSSSRRGFGNSHSKFAWEW